jgi:hypothetical protein
MRATYTDHLILFGLIIPIILDEEYSMVRPQFADGGDGFQIWRVAANILNKQSRTGDKGWSSSMRLGRGTNKSSPEKISLLRNVTRGINHIYRIHRIFLDFLHRLLFQKSRRLGKWISFSPQAKVGEKAPPVSETSCFLEYRTMEKVQKNSVNSVQHTPASESFQVC